MAETKPPPWLVFTALVSIQVLFGINYVIAKIVVQHFPPLVWASFRIIIASLLMLSVALIQKRKHPPLEKAFFVPLILYSLLAAVINQGSFLLGLHYTTATNSAILNTLIPVFTLVIVTVRGQEPLTFKRGVGFFLAFGGVLLVRKVEQISLSDKTLIGDLLTILNCLSYAIFLSISKRFLEKYDRVWTTTWLFIYGSVGLTLIATPDWLRFAWPVIDRNLFLCMIYAIVGGTLCTYFLSLWALAHTKSSSVALFIYLQPVVACLLAWALFDEHITLRTASASFLIFLGVFLGLSRQSPYSSVFKIPKPLIKG